MNPYAGLLRSIEGQTLHALGLCGVRTHKGTSCGQACFAELPCCTSHVPRWIAASFANLRAFVTPRALRVNRIFTSYDHSQVIVCVHKQLGPRLRIGRYYHGSTAAHMHFEDALVLADILAALGNAPAATRILQLANNDLRS